LLNALQLHREEAEKQSPDELIFRSIMESVGDPEDDTPPPKPEGVHSKEGEMPTYSGMIATLVDQVKAEVDKANPSNRFDAYLAEVIRHKENVEDLQKQLLEKLASLEKEESRKITSESIHTGFDSSHITKPDKKPVQSSQSAKGKEKATSVEVLNPQALNRDSLTKQDKNQSSGADADDDEPVGKGNDDDDGDVDVEPSELGKKFAQIKKTDYRALLQFINENPQVLAERESDGLLVLGFNSQLAGKNDFARQCVHHALLLQYCRTLGHDGVGLFFKRITTKGHQAQKVFLDDVNGTYDRIRTRAKEVKVREKEDAGDGGVEQIQLHAVDPGTAINITIPERDSPDESVQKARAIFDSLPPGLQRALETGELDEVNKVLGRMSVEEAEEIVGKLGEVSLYSLPHHNNHSNHHQPSPPFLSTSLTYSILGWYALPRRTNHRRHNRRRPSRAPTVRGAGARSNRHRYCY
jgi:cell division cycle protein 37